MRTPSSGFTNSVFEWLEMDPEDFLLSAVYSKLKCKQIWDWIVDIPGNFSPDMLSTADALPPEFPSIELDMPLAWVMLDIERKFFRNVKLSWINEESCSTARLTWFLMDRRRTNQLLGLGRDVISTTMAVLTGHLVMGRLAERMRLPFNNFCRWCRSAEEEETVIYFLCQFPSHAWCRYRVFGSPFLVNLMEQSSININDIASYIKLSVWFSSVG